MSPCYQFVLICLISISFYPISGVLWPNSRWNPIDCRLDKNWTQIHLKMEQQRSEEQLWVWISMHHKINFNFFFQIYWAGQHEYHNSSMEFFWFIQFGLNSKTKWITIRLSSECRHDCVVIIIILSFSLQIEPLKRQQIVV